MTRALIIHKYGGTSVADPDRIREVADHVARTVRHGSDVVVVVSAMGKETDELIRLAGDVSDVRPGREMDMLITAGERKAMALLCMAQHSIGVPADSFTGSQAGFITDTNHTNAKIVELRPDRLRKAIEAGHVPVIGGAQGVSTDHDVTFLGRGGSDTTAVALCHALEGDACELYTDVPGVFTADPRIVPKARRLGRVSFDELLEMTATGCPKPAMRSVEYARRWNVALHVRSAFTWEPGTRGLEDDQSKEQAIVSAVVDDTSEAKVTVTGVPDHPGIAARLFRELADVDVNVDMIVQNVSDHGVTDISFTVPKDDLARGTEICQRLADEIGATGVSSDRDIARVSIVGARMTSNPAVAATTFELLAAEGLHIEMISTSAIRTSCVVREGQIERAVQSLHTAFGLDAAPT
jgi:aspartate kinase